MDRFLGKKKPLSFTTKSVSDKVTDKDRFEVIFPEGYQPLYLNFNSELWDLNDVIEANNRQGLS